MPLGNFFSFLTTGLRLLNPFPRSDPLPPPGSAAAASVETSSLLASLRPHFSGRPANPNHAEATEVPCIDHVHSQPLPSHGTSKPRIVMNRTSSCGMISDTNQIPLDADPTLTDGVIPAPPIQPTDVGRPTVLPPPAPFQCASSSNMESDMDPIIDRFNRSKQNMFALIIGINDYTNCRKLSGAVADAKAMKEYLEEVLRVPEDHIRTLFDHDATRDGIIAAFEALRDDEQIQKGDPIVIFYAGHGGELPSPSTWTWWAPETKIQCLLPQDYEKSDTHPIHPIPDRTVGALVESIARVKGDNISVIFDCCHSASGTRVHNEAGYVPRTVELDHTIPDKLDQDIWRARSGKINPGFASHGLQSHVLLAACGENELAYEYDGHGQFTTALLETLKTWAIDDLTYNEVLEHIHLSQQNPHCEGFNQHRIIFDVRVPAGRQVRYSVRLLGGGQYVIGAGVAHGVSHGVEFTLYSEEKRSLGAVVVDAAAEIEDFQTKIATPLRVTNVSFAKLTRAGNLPLYLTPGGNLSLVLEEMIRQVKGTSAPNFRRVEEVKEAKLEATMKNDQVVLKVLDQQLKRLGLTDLSFEIVLDRLTHALSAAAHYYWYLDLSKENSHIDTKDGVSVNFYMLKESETEYDEYGMEALIPVEPGFYRRDPKAETPGVIDFVVNPDALYGMKITNKTTRDLYLNAFLFNNSSLSIAPYYTQTSVGTPGAPLKKDATFTMGYGSGGTPPFSYSLDEDQHVDVGYLKIFFATRPIDLSDIVQPPPFSAVDPRSWINEVRKGKISPFMSPSGPKDTWFTLEIPVVQRGEETPAAM